MSKPTISIIGMGRVGTSMHRVLAGKGYQMISVYNRSSKEAYTGLIKGYPSSVKDLGDLIFLTLPDDSIEKYSLLLSEKLSDLEDKCFVHCSGTLSSDLLKPLRDNGGSIGTFHPNMAVNSETLSFEGIYFDGEGDEKVIKMLKEICSDLNAHFLEIEGDLRQFMHMGAVIASNYLVTLAEMASRIGSKTGISKSEILKAYLPLMRSTLSNLEKYSPDQALTGPIARNDGEVVKKHLKMLDGNTLEGELYRSLGKLTAELTKDEIRNNITDLLDDSK